MSPYMPVIRATVASPNAMLYNISALEILGLVDTLEGYCHLTVIGISYQYYGYVQVGAQRYHTVMQVVL